VFLLQALQILALKTEQQQWQQPGEPHRARGERGKPSSEDNVPLHNASLVFLFANGTFNQLKVKFLLLTKLPQNNVQHYSNVHV